MSFPVISISPTESVISARRIMDRKHLHRLVVMEGDEVLGIIAQTDVLRALKEALFQAEADSEEQENPWSEV